MKSTIKEEEAPSKEEAIDVSELNVEEMTLIIKTFRQILRTQKDKDYKPQGKRVCYKCGKTSHFISNCPYANDDDMEYEKKERKRFEKKKFFKKNGRGEAHISKGWDSDESSSNDEGVATLISTRPPSS